MKVVEVMSRGLDPVDPEATVQQAATQMAELDVGAVVIGTSEALEGILTDRDIIVRVVVEGLNPAEVKVRTVMSPSVVGCSADDPVESALAQMRERQIRRMPVFGEDGKPIGIVTLSDVSKAVDSPERLAETLREIAEPHRARKVAESEPDAVEDKEPPLASAGRGV